MLPEPEHLLPDTPAPTGPQLLKLRTASENLASSTLTLLRQLRDAGLLTGSIRHQAILVACDGGCVDLGLDAAWPQAATPSTLLQSRQELRRGLIAATIANTTDADEAAGLLTARPDDAVLVERGEVALSLVDLDPDLASETADLLDARTGVSSLDDTEAAA